MDLAFSSSSSLSTLSFGSNLPATWTVEPAPCPGPRASAEPFVAQPALTEAQSEDAALLEGLLNNDSRRLAHLRDALRPLDPELHRARYFALRVRASRRRPRDPGDAVPGVDRSNDKKVRSFEQNRGTRFGTWLGLLATHTRVRLPARARRDSKCDGIEGAEALRADDAGPERPATLIRERAALVSRLLDTLSAKDRQFVELYYGEGLPAEEVAERMQISVKTVYTKKPQTSGAT